MQRYTVRKLATLAGVSVRTLHYYDEIGLLRPADRSAAGYRLYGEQELLRLQQILFYRELDVPLEEIQKILSNPRFDKAKALAHHRTYLQKEINRLQHLMLTIDKTLQHLKGEKRMLTDKELYAGFTPEQAKRYSREARELYGNEVVEKSEQRVRKMSKEAFAAVGKEGDDVTRGLAGLIDKDPGDPQVQALIKRHHAWVCNFWQPDKDSYRGLALGYTQHPEFRAFYEKYRPELADYMKKAIDYFCDHSLSQRG